MTEETHTIQAGETLSSIAARYQLPGWHALYFSDLNTNFRRSNPDPDTIHPGSAIRIPPNNDLKRLLRTRLTRLQQAKKDAENLFREQEQTFRDDLNSVKRTGQKVDSAATIALLLVSLGQLTRKAANVIKLEGRALHQANQRFAKEFAVDRTKNMRDLAATAVSNAKQEASSNAWLIVKSVAQSWCDISSPSFWANTFVNLQSGMSWSRSVTTKPEDVFQRALANLSATQRRVIADLDKKIAEVQKELAAS